MCLFLAWHHVVAIGMVITCLLQVFGTLLFIVKWLTTKFRCIYIISLISLLVASKKIFLEKKSAKCLTLVHFYKYNSAGIYLLKVINENTSHTTKNV